jgi:tRNA threonylcarbamoyladenosine biosynthesis protein TsaB
MAKILNIETSTEICSVSLSVDGVCQDLKINGIHESGPGKGSHSKLLAGYIKDILENNKILPSDLSAVAISCGPGSYTGLRIGTSTCKGFCFGADLPLIAVDTLSIMASMAFCKAGLETDLYIPMIDARRMEVYTAIFDEELRSCSDVEAKIIDESSFNKLSDKKIIFCGNGSEKCKDILKSENFVFIPDIYPSAEYMGIYSEKKFNEKKFEDLVYFEPFYLKEFVTTTPKNKINNFLNK